MQSFLEISCRLRHFVEHMFICHQVTIFDLYHHLLVLVSPHIQSPIAKFYSCASPQDSMFVCLVYAQRDLLLHRPEKNAIRLSHLLCFYCSLVTPVVMSSSFAF